MDYVKVLKENEEVFLGYYKERYPLIYNSNIFFRDMQYAVTGYFKQRGEKLRKTEAEIITGEFLNHLENEQKLVRMDKQSWKVNFSEEENVEV